MPFTEAVPTFDLYAALEVEADASTDVILAAYRRRVRAAHPDVATAPDAEATTKQLNIARDWLTDPDRRRRYDRQRGAAAIHRRVEPAAGDATVDAPVASGTDVASAARWSRGPGRGDLELFVVRCGRLERREIGRLLDEHRRSGLGEVGARTVIGERLLRQADDAGRGSIARSAATAAVRGLRSRPGADQPGIVDIVRWTAFAYAASDLAPLDAARFVAPWEHSVGTDAGPTRRGIIGPVPALAGLAVATVLVVPVALVGKAVVAAAVGLVVARDLRRRARSGPRPP